MHPRLTLAGPSLLLALALAASVDGVAAASLTTGSAPTSAPISGTATSSSRSDATNLSSDILAPPEGRRRVKKWSGRTLWYYESLPAKWDWSLSTAVAKWNASGARIKLARTTVPRRAQVRIGYGSTGTAAGRSTVGRVRNAYVHLSSRYAGADALAARNRVGVMHVLAHELGHVLGFQHTTTRCSLMAASTDLTACSMLPATRPGYYACRTIDSALVRRFVAMYGGRATYPAAAWCLIDRLPSALGGITYTGGTTSPVTVSWAPPSAAPAGSTVVLRRWAANECGVPPSDAATFPLPTGAGSWEDQPAAGPETACIEIQLVNRYGAGQPARQQIVARWVPPTPAPSPPVVENATWIPALDAFVAEASHPAGTRLVYRAGDDASGCLAYSANAREVVADPQRPGVVRFQAIDPDSCVSFFSVDDTTGLVSDATDVDVVAPAPTETPVVGEVRLERDFYPTFVATATADTDGYEIATSVLVGPCPATVPANLTWHQYQTWGSSANDPGPPERWNDYMLHSPGRGTNCALFTTVDWFAHLDSWWPYTGSRTGPVVMREFLDIGALPPSVGQATWNSASGTFRMMITHDDNLRATYDPADPRTCPSVGQFGSARLDVGNATSGGTFAITPPAPETCVSFYSDGERGHGTSLPTKVLLTVP